MKHPYLFPLTLLLILTSLLVSCTPEGGEDDTPDETTASTEPGTAAGTAEAGTEPETIPEPVPADVDFTWSNPIPYDGVDALRDPFILKVGDVWYMTGTLPPYGLADEAHRTKGVPLYVSSDLVHWSFVDYILHTPAEAEGKWYSERFWAPELFLHNGVYYLTVNCCRPDGGNHGMLVASAPDVTGPYTILTPDEPLRLGNDAHFFVDDDGQVYLFGSDIWGQRIDLDRMEFIGERFTPASPVPDSDAWNAVRAGVGFEGPYLYKTGGVYYLFYSTWARGYEVGVTRAEDLYGTWTMYADPMYGALNADSCNRYGAQYVRDAYTNQRHYKEVGHNCVFEGPDGQPWIAAHAYDSKGRLTFVIDKLVPDGKTGFAVFDPEKGETIIGQTYGEKHVTIPADAPSAQPVKALDVWLYGKQGQAVTITLPAQADVLLDNGFRRCADVSWEALPDLSVPGSYTVGGKVTYGGKEYPVTAHIGIAERVTGRTADFEGLPDGADILHDGVFGQLWDVTFTMYKEIGSPAPAAYTRDGNTVLRNQGYLLAAYRETDDLKDGYTFGIDWTPLTSAIVGGMCEKLGGIILHGADESLYAHYNEDQYKNRGGKNNTDVMNWIGNSGILILPTDRGIRVQVKTYETDVDIGLGYGIGNEYVDFPVSGYSGTQTLSVTAEEKDGRITISVNGTPTAVVELDAPGTYKGAGMTYYHTVRICAADGTVKKQVDKSFVTVKPAIHIVCRGWTACDLDNIRVTE